MSIIAGPTAREARVFLEQLLPITPDITVVLAHMTGAGEFDESAQQASAVYAEAIVRRDPRVRNLYFDACISATAEEAPFLVRRIREIGVSRILYGSDAPVEGTYPSQALARWHKLGLTAEEFHSIETNVAPFLRPPPHNRVARAEH
jgi:predicted TIM-barrel fold metal-dependent hydrolase